MLPHLVLETGFTTSPSCSCRSNTATVNADGREIGNVNRWQRMDFTVVSGFVQTSVTSQEETGGRFVELEIVLKPGARGAPRHVHTHQEERFEVKEGVVDVFHSGAWHKLEAGQVAVVPPGMPDESKNTSAKPATLLGRISPVLDFQDMNVTVMKLINDGKIRSQKDV